MKKNNFRATLVLIIPIIGSYVLFAGSESHRVSENKLIPQDNRTQKANHLSNTFYVNNSHPSASDSNPGTYEQPWLTMQHAADIASYGDSVCILSGTYSSVTFRNSGTNQLPIKFSGTDTSLVKIHGGIEFAAAVRNVNLSGVTVENFSGWGVFVRGNNRNIRLNNLHVSGGECGIHLTWGYQAQDPLDGPVSNIIIENSTIDNCTYTALDGTPGPCDSLTFRNLDIFGAGTDGQNFWGADGIAIERGSHITVENCHIHDNGGDGVDLNSRDFNGNVNGIVVRGNRILRNRMTGIKIWSGGKIENNVIAGMGNCPVFIGTHPGIYSVVNNTIAWNMRNPDYSVRNYAFVAAYPDDISGVSSQIELTLLNNIFAFNCSDQMGGQTGIYLGEGVTLVSEGYNCFWSRGDGEIQAEFVSGDSWFSRSDITDGSWAVATGQGAGEVLADPYLNDPAHFDFRLHQQSPSIDAGHPDNQYLDKNGTRNDIGAYGGPFGWSYDYPGPVSSFQISGEVNYHTSDAGVPNVTLSLYNADTLTWMTNEEGDFQFQNISGGVNYSLLPVKSDDIAPSTILSYDASLAAQIAVNLMPNATQFQVIAADADVNGTVQMYDASLIARNAVGLPPLSDSQVEMWTFSPERLTFQPLNVDVINANFTGIVLGDVDGSWTSLNAAHNNFHDGDLPFEREIEERNNQQFLVVSVSASEGEEIFSCDMILKYNPSHLQYHLVSKTPISDHFEVHVNDLNPDSLRIGAFAARPLTDVGAYLEIEFRILNITNLQTVEVLNYRINDDSPRKGLVERFNNIFTI